MRVREVFKLLLYYFIKTLIALFEIALRYLRKMEEVLG